MVEKRAEKWGKFVVIWKRFKNCTNNHKRKIRRKGKRSEREENDDDNDEQWRIRTFSWPRITNDVVNVASFWPQRKIYHRNRDANRRERHWNKFMCISVFDYYLNLLWLCFSFARFPSFSLLAVVFSIWLEKSRKIPHFFSTNFSKLRIVRIVVKNCCCFRFSFE